MNRFEFCRFTAVAFFLAAGAVCAQPREGDANRLLMHRDLTNRAGRGPSQELRAIKALRKAVHKELDLSEEQADRIDELFEEHTESIKELLRRQREERRDQAKKMAEIRREMREAREQQDQDRLGELREKLRGSYGVDGALRDARKELHEALADDLDADQKKKLRHLIARVWRDVSSRRFGPSVVATTWRILQELDLRTEQRRDMARVMAEVSREMRASQEDPDGRSAFEHKMREEIVALLDEEQKSRFLELERERRKSLEESAVRGHRMDEEDRESDDDR